VAPITYLLCRKRTHTHLVRAARMSSSRLHNSCGCRRLLMRRGVAFFRDSYSSGKRVERNCSHLNLFTPIFLGSLLKKVSCSFRAKIKKLQPSCFEVNNSQWNSKYIKMNHLKNIWQDDDSYLKYFETFAYILII
jgi:hypothetical protein